MILIIIIIIIIYIITSMGRGGDPRGVRVTAI